MSRCPYCAESAISYKQKLKLMFDTSATATCSKCHGSSSVKYGPAFTLVVFLLWAAIDAVLDLNRSLTLKIIGLAVALIFLLLLVGILPLQRRLN